MGKASKWLISFLLGKKEKEKRSDAPPQLDGTIVPAVVLPPQSTKVKRGWSFGKSASKVTSQTHKPSRSMDSLESGQLVRQVRADQYPLVVRGHKASSVMPKDERRAVAAKIQAVFQSYLARKALCALRSLVKIQSLARGFLVRKQTTATMRSMLHVLMNIQVRAHAHRILMADHLNGTVSRQLLAHRKSLAEFDHRKLHKERSHTLFDETSQVLKSKSSHFVNRKVERMEQSFTAYYSGDLSIVKQGGNTKSLSIPRHRAHRGPFLPSRKQNPQGRCPLLYKRRITLLWNLDYPTTQHYMVNTESSRAKTSSQSEPKQRPKCSIKHKSKRNGSDDGKDMPIDAQM